MNLQYFIIKRYMDLSDKVTYKSISVDTGIQLTRIFRIIHGQEMRISEFEKFAKAIRKIRRSTKQHNL